MEHQSTEVSKPDKGIEQDNHGELKLLTKGEQNQLRQDKKEAQKNQLKQVKKGEKNQLKQDKMGAEWLKQEKVEEERKVGHNRKSGESNEEKGQLGGESKGRGNSKAGPKGGKKTKDVVRKEGKENKEGEKNVGPADKEKRSSEGNKSGGAGKSKKAAKGSHKLPTCKFHDVDKSKQGAQVKTMSQGLLINHNDIGFLNIFLYRIITEYPQGRGSQLMRN